MTYGNPPAAREKRADEARMECFAAAVGLTAA